MRNIMQIKNHLLAVLAVFTFALHSGAQTTPIVSETRAIHEDLTRLHLTLERHAAEFASDGGSGAMLMEPMLEDLRAELEHLTLRAEALTTDDRTMLRKVRQLEPLLANLEKALVLSEPPPAPPRRQVLMRSLGAPVNDACANAQLITQESTPGTTLGATNDGHASCGSSYFSPDVWFEFNATENASISADLLGAGFDAVLSVHRDCPGTTSRENVCNDDTFGLDPAVTFHTSPGDSYWIRVSGFDGTSGDFELHLGPGGRIRGRVTDSVTGTPLSDGSVRAIASTGYFGSTTTPSIDGTYEMSVTSDIYTLHTRFFDGYLNQVWDRLQCFPNCPSEGVPIDVRTNSDVSDINFILDPEATLTGTVTDAMEGTSVVNAEVDIFDTAGVYLMSGYSNGSGTYSIPGLPGGDFFAAASHQGYRPQVYENVPCDPSGCLSHLGTPIPVFTGDTTSGIDFTLQSRGRISGVVTHLGSGEPIPNARVFIRNGRDDGVAEARTAADGSYTVGGLESGTYFALAVVSSYQTQIWDGILCSEDPWDCDARWGAEISVTNDTTISGVDFSLPRFGSLSGTVTDGASGDPLEGAVVHAQKPSGSSLGIGRTNSEGIYQISGLAPDSYFVLSTPPLDYLQELYDGVLCPHPCQVTTGTPVQVELNSNTLNIDFQHELGGSIAGTVTSAETGLPLSIGRVEILDTEGHRIGSDSVGNDGQYLVERLPPGNYLALTTQHFYYADELYDDVYCHQGCGFSSGKLISVGLSEDVTGIDFALEVAMSGTGAIQGTVQADPSGAPLPDIQVTLYDAFGMSVHQRWTDALGNYNFDGLTPGIYFVRTHGNETHADELFDDMPCEEDCIVLLGSAVTVADEVIAGIDFRLRPLGAVAGTVVDSLSGEPVDHASVEIWAEDGSLVSRIASGGEYEVYLPPGTYFVTARNQYAHYGNQLWNGFPCAGRDFLDCDVTTGTPVVVGSEIVTGIDLALDPPGRLSGRVTQKETGLPLANAWIEFWDTDGHRITAASTNNNGIFTSSYMQPGSVYVTTDAWLYFDELYSGRPCSGGAPLGCDPTKGDPVEVTAGMTTRHLNFDLAYKVPGNANLLGRVTDEAGDPLPGVAIDFWDEYARLQETRYTDTQGEFSYNLEPGDTFYVSTDSADGVVDEVWPDIVCLSGSAFQGHCDPTTGAPVSGADGLPHFVEFRLMSQSVFADGFESGNLTAWSFIEFSP